MNMRHWVLVAPFGPNDFTIYSERDERRAIADFSARRAVGEDVSFTTTSGTVADVRVTLKALRAERLAKVSC